MQLPADVSRLEFYVQGATLLSSKISYCVSTHVLPIQKGW